MTGKKLKAVCARLAIFISAKYVRVDISSDYFCRKLHCHCVSTRKSECIDSSLGIFLSVREKIIS
jgi:hypothetical protein